MTGLQAFHFSRPWSQAVGGQISAFPFSQSESVCLDKTNCLPLEYTARPRPCCLDQHSSSPDWGERSSCTRFTFYRLIPPSPAHTAPSPWCCHNGNEMNCKLPTNLLWDMKMSDLKYGWNVAHLLLLHHVAWYLIDFHIITHSCLIQQHSSDVTV